MILQKERMRVPARELERESVILNRESICDLSEREYEILQRDRQSN